MTMRWPAAAAIASAWGLLLIAAGGAADAPGAVWLGAPAAAAAGLATAAVLGLALWCRAGVLPLLGLAPLLLAVTLAAPAVGLRALTGPPLLAVVAGAMAIALVAAGRRPPARLFFPAVLALHSAIAFRVQVQVGPEGDEPHYLMVADSLLRDGDLSLERDYAVARYGAFFPRPLQPHYRIRGRDGAIYSLHAVGLSVLILPAYALGGYPAVSFFMAALAAWLAREIRELIREWTGQDGLAEGVGWLVALSPPLIHYAGLVFTEVPAALLVALALRHGRRLASGRAAAVCGMCVAALPWLNVRNAVIAAGLLAYALSRRAPARATAALLAAPIVSAAALALFHWRLYGFFDPRLVYGRRPEFALATLPEGLPGLLLDQEFGLLVYAPYLVLAATGLLVSWRERKAEAAVTAFLVASVALVAGSWHMWRGGFNPPARFLLPVLPVLAAAAAFALRRGLGAAAAIVVGWSLWTGLAGAWQPRLVHRDRDGTAPLFRTYSGAEEWTRLLPGYVLADPDRHRRAVVWSLALAAVAAVAARSGRPTPARVAAGWAGLAAAAGLASAISNGKTGGRDAVRVIGRPALSVPGWSIQRRDARWGPEVLGWGPVYEPHRHPGGAPVGERLGLPIGTYRLTLAAEDLAGGASPGQILVRTDGATGPRRGPLRRRSGGFEVDLEVKEGERAVTILVEGGGPFLLEEVRLELQPFDHAAGRIAWTGSGLTLLEPR
jgi:hypothetical protein